MEYLLAILKVVITPSIQWLRTRIQSRRVRSDQMTMRAVHTWLAQLSRDGRGDALHVKDIGSESYFLFEKMVDQHLLERVAGVPGLYTLPGRIPPQW